MEITLSDPERAFRDEVRDFFAREIPAGWDYPSGTDYFEIGEQEFARLRAWQKKLAAHRLIGITWPEAYGGRGASPLYDAILHEEMVRAGAPPTINALGITLCGPALLHHGTEEQKERYLARMLSGEELWCQGYSEPGSGSDLASLRTRAELRGDDYVVNGQKVWTSDGQYADWMFCLVRTDANAPKHRGIGFLLIDMHTPGVEVRPLRQMTGGSEFCEVFLNDVVVPRENMVGAPTEGWQIANTVLGYERGTQALSGCSRFEADFARLLELMRGAPGLAGDPRVRQRTAQLKIELSILRLIALDGLARLRDGRAPGAESSMGKLAKSELEQRLYELAVELQGPYAALREGARAIDAGRWHWRMLWSRAATIYAGTNEIQRNIIAQRVLGLPRP
ncbi:MAG TPA: acyl-CoA dehydrogenase family protein [Candidatus Bathyarchaeia archaeon]|nr:acyl-CoA dehydrogenase family protein [Candidatus Bathyarchaeia archaeon]